MTNPTNWRVRTKLIAILAVPVIAILVNSSIQAASVLTSTRDVNRIRDLIEINRSAATLVDLLQQERTYTTGYVASGHSAGVMPAVDSRRTSVNDALTAYQKVADRHRGSFGPEVDNALDNIDDAMGRLAVLRDASSRISDSNAVRTAYRPLIDSLIDLVVLIPQGNDDQELLTSVTAYDHLVRANEELATAQALIYGVKLNATQPFSTDNYREFLTTYSQRTELIREFEGDATAAQAALYRETVNPEESPDVEKAAIYTEQVLEASTGVPLTTNDFDAPKWARAAKETIELTSEVSASILDDSDDRVDELRGSIQRGALLSGLLIVIILATALLAAVVVARSLVRPLLSLRTAALDVAGRRLPEAVRRLRETNDQTMDDDVEPIGIDSDEEIGEVARAFDAVHREAVRLASEQAVLRNNVNAMFVNLSRRSQGLVERQLRLIDDLENREQDPDQLANLFKLDHLATRMRRNNESLLVLAGTDTARRWTHPVPVNEVVLAAISEVEQYTRVKQTGAAPVSIAGSGVSDVVHLIAELLENATSYSPPVTDVMVSSHSLGPGAGAMIEIEDQGIGMPAKELERVNERLANPPIVDVSVSRTMGLFAVGRLAGRHGIKVQLRESSSGGITAVVRLPAKLVTGDSGTIPGGPRPAVAIPAGGSRPPALPSAPERNGMGASLQTTNFNPVVDPATASAAGGSSIAPGTNGNGYGSAPGSGEFTSPSGTSLFGGPVPERPGGRNGQFPREGQQFSRDAQRPGDGQFPRDAQQFSREGQQSPRDGQFSREGQYPREPRDPRDLRDLRPPDGSPDGFGPEGPDTSGAFPLQERTGPDDSAELALESFDSGPVRYLDNDGYDEGTRTGEQSYDQIAPSGPQDLPAQFPAYDTGGYPIAGIRPGDEAPSGPLQLGPPSEPSRMYSEPDTNALSRPGGVFNRAPERPSPDHGDAFPNTGPNLAAAFRSRRETGPAETGPFTQPALSRAEETGEIPSDEPEGEDTLTTPIFDSVSAWFQRRTPLPTNGAAPANGNGAVSVNGASNGRPAPVRPGGPSRGRGQAGPPVQATPLPRRSQPPAPTTRPTGPSPTPRTAPAQGEPFLDSPGRGMRRPGLGMPTPAAAQASRPVPQHTGPQHTGPQPMAPAAQSAAGSWSSAGDEGWRAAEQLRQPNDGGTTRSGLPVRVPMTHLVPGSAEPAPRRRPPEPATRSPQVVGGRLASFYQGVRQGRDVQADTTRNPRRDAQEER